MAAVEIHDDEQAFLEYVQGGGAVETTDWLPEDYRAKLIKFIEMHGNSELMGVLPEREWILRAPTLQRKLALTAKVQDEVGHAQLIYRVVAQQLDVATVFIREWRYLEGERRDAFIAERRRYEERFRALFREGRERGELRTDLDDGAAALVALSSVNWAYTWLRPGAGTDELADRFTALLLDGMRGYSS